jgi:hypothetical protein
MFFRARSLSMGTVMNRCVLQCAGFKNSLATSPKPAAPGRLGPFSAESKCLVMPSLDAFGQDAEAEEARFSSIHSRHITTMFQQ